MDFELLMFIAAQVCTAIGWGFLVFSYTREDIDDLLKAQIAVCIFDIIAYVLLGADAGLFICFFELIKTILYYKTNKDNLIFWLSLVAYTVIALLTVREWYALLPILGSAIDSFGASRDSKMANICSMISNTLWAIYDVIIMSYVGALCDSAVVLCNIGVLVFGFSRVMHISRLRVVKYSYLSKRTLKKIHALDEKNYGADHTWDNNYQLKAYKKNNDSFFAVKYKHDLVGYINYFNLDPDEYAHLKRVRKMPSEVNLDKILKFKMRRKAYVYIESVNVRKEYEKEQMTEIIRKKLASFVKAKWRQKIYIHGLLGYAMSDYEKEMYQLIGFTKVRVFDDESILFELDESKIKRFLLK